MARRLATSGYYVMLPNMYYRSGVMELGPLPADPESPERKRMFQLMASINIPLVMEDTRALLAYAESQSAARTDIVGTVGYCMSGRYAINAATHFPERVRAAASIYGTHLVTDEPDSPHLAARKDQGRTLFRLRRDRYLRARGNHREGEAANEGRSLQCRGRDLSRHASRLRVPEAAGLRSRRRRAALGTAAGALSPQPRPNKPQARCPSFDRLPGVRSHRHCDRAVRDTLVCAGLYRRHRAGLDLRPRADQERNAVGRTGAASHCRKWTISSSGSRSASSLAAAPAMCCSTTCPSSSSTRRRFSNCGKAACRSTAVSSAASRR